MIGLNIWLINKATLFLPTWRNLMNESCHNLKGGGTGECEGWRMVEIVKT
jgi:hypothetical protein